jgi:DNA repair protein RadC
MSATGDFVEPPGAGRRHSRREGDAGIAAETLASLLEAALEATAQPVATALLATFGSVAAVLAARHWQLATVPGMNDAAVRLVEAAYAVQRWAAQEEIRGRELLDGPAAVEWYVRVSLRGRTVEEAHGLFLDARNYLIRDLLLSEGTVDRIPLYPREVVRQALLLDASALILVHNHPSGDPTPSLADIELTRRVAAALCTVDIALHDHLIVGDNRITSLRAMKAL